MAIAFDAATDGGNNASASSSLTWSHTSGAGTNRLLFINAVGDSTDVITGVTVGGVAATLVGKVIIGGSARCVYTYCFVGQASGSVSVVVNASATIFIAGHSVSYNGCSQVQPEATNTGTSASTATFNLAVTTLSDNAWVFALLKNDAGAGSAGAGTTNRLSTATGGMASCDANAAKTPAGSVTLQETQSATAWSGVICAFAPFVASTINGQMLNVF